MLTPLEIEEDQVLAPYALHHTDNGGRAYDEMDDPLRTCFQRDRDRIVHSKAFRRLGYKTQVFVNSEGDNYRTRLTHSLEVGQISRSVCAALKLNQDFAEMLALAHDLGHTPFGHAGQDTLHALMKNHGGFEHNCQSLRIVIELETRYLGWNGLNLTRASLKGMMKHARIYSCDTSLSDVLRERSGERPVLESAVVDLCDRIAYVHHDVEDGLDAGILTTAELEDLPMWREAREIVKDQEGERFTQAREPLRVRAVIRRMLARSINDVIETTRGRISRFDLRSASDVKSLPAEDYPVRLSDTVWAHTKDVQSYLYNKLYRDPRVMQMSRRGCRVIETLFAEFVQNPEMMPVHIQNRIAKHGLHRVVADYIAGMTDRFAVKEHAYITGLTAG